MAALVTGHRWPGKRWELQGSIPCGVCFLQLAYKEAFLSHQLIRSCNPTPSFMLVNGLGLAFIVRQNGVESGNIKQFHPSLNTLSIFSSSPNPHIRKVNIMVLDSGSKRAVHVQGKAATHSFYQVGYEQAAAATKYKFARYKSQEPIIPSPDIFDFESSTNNRTTVSADSAGFRLPLAAECAAHLELLEVFYVLRQRILRSPEIDAAMGIIPIRQTKTGVNGDTKTLKDQASGNGGRTNGPNSSSLPSSDSSSGERHSPRKAISIFPP